MEAYPPSLCCTLAAAALATPTVVAAVICLFVAAKMTAAAFVALVAAPAVVFDVAAAEFPADVATFHLASPVGVTAVASIPVGASCLGGEIADFSPFLITFCHQLGPGQTFMVSLFPMM